MQWAAIFISASENTKLLLQVFLYQAEQFAWTKLTDIGMHESCKTNKILQAYIFEQESQESYLKWASIILVKKKSCKHVILKTITKENTNFAYF